MIPASTQGNPYAHQRDQVEQAVLRAQARRDNAVADIYELVPELLKSILAELVKRR
jgi:hypothetical protein